MNSSALKSPKSRKSLIGKHVDDVIAEASKGHYICDVVYGKPVKRSAGRKVLTISVDSENIVRQIR
jgi:hypothetical protein